MTSQTLQIPLQSNANIEDMCQPDLPTLYTECQHLQKHTMNPSLKNLLPFARRWGAANALPNLLPRAIDKCVATQPRCSTWRESTSNLDSLFFFSTWAPSFWCCRCEELEIGILVAGECYYLWTETPLLYISIL